MPEFLLAISNFLLVIFPFGTDISKTVSILKSVVDSQSQIDLQQPLIIGK